MAVSLFTEAEVSGTPLSAQHGNISGGILARLNAMITLMNANETALAGATYPFNDAGSIAAAADFPTSAAVDKGDVYKITANVIDNDATKTNTGLGFQAGDEIYWTGATWRTMGAQAGLTMVAATPHTVAATDIVLVVDTTTIAGASVVDLPAVTAAMAGRRIAVIDQTGSAGTWNIAVTPNGTDEIDGVNAAVNIDVNHGAFAVYCDGTGWITDVAVRETILNTTHRGSNGTDHSHVAHWAAGQVAAETAIAVGDSPYTALATDVVIVVDCSGGPVTVNLPAGSANRTYTILDAGGDAATSNITIVPDGAETIEGGANLVLNTNFAAAQLIWDGTDWNVLTTKPSPAFIEAHLTAMDMVPGAPPGQYNAALNGTAGGQFLPKELIFRCTAGAALNGDVTVTVGTAAGGTQLLVATQLTGLDTADEIFRIPLAGEMPNILGNATLYCDVTIADTGGGATGTMELWIKGEQV